MTQEQFEEEIRNLLESSNRIQAISRYREETGVGLAEAKNAVERLAATGSLPERVPVDDSELFEEVARHLGRGEALLAIKLVRERTGLGLKESKEVVDRIGVDSGRWNLDSSDHCLDEFRLTFGRVSGGDNPLEETRCSRAERSSDCGNWSKRSDTTFQGSTLMALS